MDGNAAIEKARILPKDGFFRDEFGRALILRGVNLAGSSKVPFRPAPSDMGRKEFFDHRHVSFVGRPFPLEEAGEHFARLRAWGLTFERLVIPWEAIEHEGPGLYDEEFLDYIEAVVRTGADFGIQFFVDPHEDVWSRFAGGDGAPGWTFEAAGLDITRFKATGAAVTQEEYEGRMPPMLWPTNHGKLAAMTMFTLFFAGNDFAPNETVDGEPIQDWLQRRFYEAFAAVAKRLKGLPNVVGFDNFNEPGVGYIGKGDLNDPPTGFKIGEIPTPYQGMLLGAGFPQEVDVWNFRVEGPERIGRRLLNPGGERAWLPGRECLWRRHGVWDLDPAGTPVLLRPDYFAAVGDRPVDFNRDYLKPFVHRFAAAIRAVEPRFLIFLETNRRQRLPDWGPEDAPGIVSAPHWYDGTVLYTKKFDPNVGSDLHGGNLIRGADAIRKTYARQLREFQERAVERLRGAPTLFGEVGIPFDLDGRRALRTGDFSVTILAMERRLRAMDDALASYTLWDYAPDNTNERGDQWNDENLSIFGLDQRTDPADIHSGGRALESVARPYARATAGEPLSMSFDIRRRIFLFEFRHSDTRNPCTELFLPAFQYPKGYSVSVSDGRWESDPESQTLRYYHTADRPVHTITVTPR